MKLNNKSNELIREITPVRIRKYLLRAGWKEDVENFDKFSIFHHKDKIECQVMLPTKTDFLDYTRRIRELIEQISNIENRNEVEIFNELLLLSEIEDDKNILSQDEISYRLNRIDWIKLLSFAINNRKTSWKEDAVIEWRNASDEIHFAVRKFMEEAGLLRGIWESPFTYRLKVENKIRQKAQTEMLEWFENFIESYDLSIPKFAYEPTQVFTLKDMFDLRAKIINGIRDKLAEKKKELEQN